MSHPLDILRNIFNLSPDLIEKLNGKIKEMHMPKGSTLTVIKTSSRTHII